MKNILLGIALSLISLPALASGNGISCLVSLAQQTYQKVYYKVDSSQAPVVVNYDPIKDGPEKQVYLKVEVAMSLGINTAFGLKEVDDSSEADISFNLATFDDLDVKNKIYSIMHSGIQKSNEWIEEEAKAFTDSVLLKINDKLLGIAVLSCLRN